MATCSAFERFLAVCPPVPLRVRMWVIQIRTSLRLRVLTTVSASAKAQPGDAQASRTVCRPNAEALTIT